LALFVCVVFLAIGIVRYILLYRRLNKWNRILFVETKPEKEEKQSSDQEIQGTTK